MSKRQAYAIVTLLVALAMVVGWARVAQRPAPQIVNAENRVRGVFHVHSTQSHDGRLSLDEIVEGAAKLGLSFVVITDHNVPAEPDQVYKGIQLIFAPEKSTPEGHVITLNGVQILAHPKDPKRPWTGDTRTGGLEIANVATSFRRYAKPLMLPLAGILFSSVANENLAMAQLYDRDDEALELWDKLPVNIGFCAADAHGYISAADNFRYWQVAIHKTHRADTATEIRGALAAGAFDCVAGFLGDPPSLNFYTENGSLHLQTSPPLPLVVFRNGEEILSGTSPLELKSPAPGIYRFEAYTQIPNLFSGQREVPIAYSQRRRI